ncbi:MAG TPA: lactonase family protein, partial [Acidobacteriaceae bacterium]|nr:lactonase family protein [Acidobacteriaceae bacterium]
MSRRLFLAGLSALPLAVRWSFASATKSNLMFAGTYTNKGSSKGIYAYRWNPASGTLESLGLAAETSNPTFLAISPDQHHLYAVNEVGVYNGAKTGSVSAFSIDHASGKLTLKNVLPTDGGGPAHLAVDHTGKSVIVANYGGGSISSYAVQADGSLQGPVSHFQFSGHGPNPERQTTPHAHCATVSPDNRFVLVNDLGLDRVWVFRLDAAKGTLTANTPPFYESEPGAGPRHFAFHPNGKWAYSVNEMGSSVDALAWDRSN